ncbi:carbonic anhydrase 2-like [Varroa destructor]|uniref:carbonic anhydrase n=1 Tax=Varroa destructor TaxID=109461 RepID=A0A7M7KGP7_VARDE|nr:carbonic anhydrase 2-like [Varroa destructor]
MHLEWPKDATQLPIKTATYIKSGLIDYSAQARTVKWAYEGRNGFENWPNIKAKGFQCGGRRQSPIDISRTNSKYRLLPKLRFCGFDVELENITASIVHGSASITDLQNSKRYISGGPLTGRYNVFGLHFHWGRRLSSGSEHTFDGRRYPIELHIVHVKDDYATFEEARNHPDGICVLAVMFVIGKPFSSTERDLRAPTRLQNEAEKHIMEYFTTVSGLQKLQIWKSGFRLSGLLPLYPQQFYTYRGSLTTPPCSEAVIWILFHHKIPISRQLLRRFHELEDSDGHHTFRNWRSTQPINQRTVYRTVRFWEAY